MRTKEYDIYKIALSLGSATVGGYAGCEFGHALGKRVSPHSKAPAVGAGIGGVLFTFGVPIIVQYGWNRFKKWRNQKPNDLVE
jgi:hypothetical protein